MTAGLHAGDVGVLLAGTALVATLAWWSWGGERGDSAVIRAGECVCPEPTDSRFVRGEQTHPKPHLGSN